jgi:predicted nuclease of predicted toxin-antitoxin system
MKFKIDENLPSEIKHLLIQAGHDALTVKDQELTGHPDTNLAVVCLAENRTFITADLDFFRYPGLSPGKIPRNHGDPVGPPGQTNHG